MKHRMRFGALALTAMLAMAACTAEVKEEGSLPDVDVSGGEAPKIDVDPAQVNVGTDTNTVVTPDIDVSAPAESR